MAEPTANYNGILIGAQIFGYAANLYSQAKEAQSVSMGTRLDRQAIGLQMQAQALQATQESAAAAKNLQKTLATQRAILGARGQAGGQGSALAATNESLRAYGQEEKARTFAATYNTHQLKAQQAILNINKNSYLGQSAAKNSAALFQNISFNELIGKGRNKPKEIGEDE